MRKASAIGVPSSDFARGPARRMFARSSAGPGLQASGSVLEIYDEIGGLGVTASAFRAQLSNITGDVTVRINSPGGDVFDGITIYNDLVAYKGNVRVEVVGVAASAASLIAMAGNEIAIAANAHFMIHNSWVVAMGHADDLDAVSAYLRKIDASLALTYAARTGDDARSMAAIMQAETWLMGEEAIEAGFADELLPSAEPSARFDLSPFAKVPDQLKCGATDQHSISSKDDLIHALSELGLPARAARKVAAGGWPALKAGATQPEPNPEFSKLASKLNAAAAELRVIRS